LAGFLFGNLSAGILPASEADTFMLLANFAFSLIALTFGLVARHRRVSLNPAQRNFGVQAVAPKAWPMSGYGASVRLLRYKTCRAFPDVHQIGSRSPVSP
jgi:hypothetical protein